MFRLDEKHLEKAKEIALNNRKKKSCALGSVKSMIGHTKAAAGAAGPHRPS